MMDMASPCWPCLSRAQKTCGQPAEQMPWASGKHRLAQAYAWFLARWPKRLSWKEVAEVFRSSWDSVFRSVEMAVEWGRAHQDLSGIEVIGIDEISRQRGHRYLALVYQIDRHCKRAGFIPWAVAALLRRRSKQANWTVCPLWSAR